MTPISTAFGYTGPNKDLCDALYEGNTDAIKAALKLGADPNAPSNNGETLLSLTVQWHRPGRRQPNIFGLSSTAEATLRSLISARISAQPSIATTSNSWRHSKRRIPDWNVVGDWRSTGPSTLLDDLDANIALVKAGHNCVKSRPRDLAKMLRLRDQLVSCGAKTYGELNSHDGSRSGGA